MQLARIDGRDDVFLASQNEIRRLRGDNAQPIWQISVAARDQPLVEKAVHGNLNHLQFFSSGTGSSGSIPPSVARPALDSMATGGPDLIWASRTLPALVAVSGKSGKVCGAMFAMARFATESTTYNFPKAGAGRQHRGNDCRRAAAGGSRRQEGRPCRRQALVQELFMPAKKHEWLRADRELAWRRVDAQTGNLTLAAAHRLEQRRYRAKRCSGRPYGGATAASSPHSSATTACRASTCSAASRRGPTAISAPPRTLVVRFADLRGDGELEALLWAGKTTELRLTAISPKSPAPLWERAGPRHSIILTRQSLRRQPAARGFGLALGGGP